MPLTAHMRQSIDDIRNYLYGGGYPDPVSNAEQLSFLFFFYLVEGIDAENKARARFLKRTYKSPFTGDWELKNPLNAAAGSAVHDSRGSAATVLSTEPHRVHSNHSIGSSARSRTAARCRKWVPGSTSCTTSPSGRCSTH